MGQIFENKNFLMLSGCKLKTSCYRFHLRGHSTTTWTEFCHFLTPPLLRGQFLYSKRGQKQTFFDTLPSHLVHVVIEWPQINFILSISIYQLHSINFILSISTYQFQSINYNLSILFYQFFQMESFTKTYQLYASCDQKCLPSETWKFNASFNPALMLEYPNTGLNTCPTSQITAILEPINPIYVSFDHFVCKKLQTMYYVIDHLKFEPTWYFTLILFTYGYV